MALVALKLPPEVLRSIAEPDVGPERGATSLAAVGSPSARVASLDAGQLQRRLPGLAEALREWVFRNADTVAPTLTVVSGERTRQLDLPPNVSVRTITEAISEILPR